METKTNRFRKNNCNLQSIQTKITQQIKAKKGTSSATIISLLKCLPNFIGCFAENQVSHLIFKTFPCYLIVNIDSSQLPGSHWLALGVYQNRIEIFDPLGFKIFKWSSIPCELLQFLHRLVGSRKLKISKRIQSSNSNLCGFYCIFYVMMRPYFSWNMIQQQFTVNLTNNDLKLIKLLE